MSRLALLDAGPSGAGVAAFDPLSLSPAAWYDASQITGKNDGDAISSWPDLSGNGRHAVQANATLQPVYKTAIQNGKPVVRGDGNDDTLRVSFTLNQPAHWFAVLADRAVAASAQDYLDGTTAFSHLLSRRSATTIGIYAGTAVVAVQTTTPGAFHVHGYLFNGASSEYRVDGGSAQTGNPGPANAGGIALFAGTPHAALDIGEVLVFPAALAAADRQAVEAYLKGKWGTP